MPDSTFGAAVAPSLVVRFTVDKITAVRRAVSRQAAGAGLVGDQLHDFVLAVNEIVTNAVVHGGGRGELRMWDNGQILGCEITDAGPGGVLDAPTEPTAQGGRHGLRLARLLVDRLEVVESSGGTAVRLMTGLQVAGPQMNA